MNYKNKYTPKHLSFCNLIKKENKLGHLDQDYNYEEFCKALSKIFCMSINDVSNSYHATYKLLTLLNLKEKIETNQLSPLFNNPLNTSETYFSFEISNKTPSHVIDDRLNANYSKCKLMKILSIENHERTTKYTYSFNNNDMLTNLYTILPYSLPSCHIRKI